MIDWIKSAEMNDCTVEWLKARFVRFQKSHKKVIRICETCLKSKAIAFCDYHDLCNTCSKRTPETRKKMSDSAIERCSDPKWKKSQGDKFAQWHQDNPEANRDIQLLYNQEHPEKGIKHSKYKKQWCVDNPERVIEQGKKHSVLMKEHYSRMDDPGLDIVKHHYLYDDADLSKHTMPMTRSDHTRMHNYMREDGYEVPHINSATDDNGLWGYKE